MVRRSPFAVRRWPFDLRDDQKRSKRGHFGYKEIHQKRRLIQGCLGELVINPAEGTAEVQ